MEESMVLAGRRHRSDRVTTTITMWISMEASEDWRQATPAATCRFSSADQCTTFQHTERCRNDSSFRTANWCTCHSCRRKHRWWWVAARSELRHRLWLCPRHIRRTKWCSRALIAAPPVTPAWTALKRRWRMWREMLFTSWTTRWTWRRRYTSQRPPWRHQLRRAASIKRRCNRQTTTNPTRQSPSSIWRKTPARTVRVRVRYTARNRSARKMVQVREEHFRHLRLRHNVDGREGEGRKLTKQNAKHTHKRHRRLLEALRPPGLDGYAVMPF